MARRGGRGTDRGTGERGRRGADDGADTGSWSLGEYEWQGGDRTGPPWEQDGWEGTPTPPPGQPLGSLSAGHPSGPLPPVAGRRGRRPSGDYPTGDYPAGGSPGADGPGPRRGRRGYDTGAYPAAPDDTGAFGADSYQAGGYDTGSFAADSHDRAPRDTGSSAAYDTGSFDAGGYDAVGWDGSGYRDDGASGERYYDEPGDEAVARRGFAGGGLGHAAPGGGSFAQAPGGRRDQGPGMGARDAYQEYPEYDDEDDYDAGDDWYEDGDDQRDWVDEEDDDEAFLPGLSSVHATRAGEADGRRGRGRPTAQSRPKRKSRMRRLAPWIALSVLLAVIGGGGGFGYYVYRTYLHPPDYSGAGAGSVVVRVKPGDTATTVGQILLRDGVVASVRAFHNAAVADPKGNALEPGYYRLHKRMQASLALAMLLNPSSRVVYKVLIREGLRLSQIVATLGQQTHDVSGYQAAIKDAAALGLPSYAGGKPEGYLFPSTYQVLPNTPPVKVLQEMVAQFKQQVAGLQLPKWAAHDQLTPAQVIVVASLIQAEGRKLSDFPKIARVIYNRLNSQMQLELDSTVMYALNSYGIQASQAQLNAASKSPYDTYAHYGLPPGPIDSPGVAAIQAALHPAQGDWLYFVTVNPKTGLTKFTSDYNTFLQYQAELNAAVAKGGG